MKYTTLLPPKSLLPAQSFPIRGITPLRNPPVDNITLPPVPTIRKDSGSTQTGTTNTHQPFTFYTASSPKGVKYKLTTHLYPSAYPRSPYRFGSVPIDITEYERIGNEAKKDVREKMFAEYMTVLDQWAGCVNRGLEGGCEDLENYESVCATQRRVMWNSVNRIVRESGDEDPNRERVTLFVAHANGFLKETWEPTIQSLLSQMEGSAPPQSSKIDTPDNAPIIEEIWVFEAVQHGDTGLINAGLLPRAYDWLDNVRDILQFMLYYIPDRVEQGPSVLPTHLTRLPETTATLREKEGFGSRTVVGIGHSFGGCSVTRAAIEHPSLFSSLVLVDPVIRPIGQSRTFSSHLADNALKRRNVWKSKEEARTSFFKSPFFKKWNPDVLNAYIEHAIVEEDGVAKLKMSGLYETILFLHRQVTFETWELLPQLNSSIPVFWIVSGLDGVALGGLDVLPETVWRRPDNSSNVVLPVGHLIPHEAPIELASLVRQFLIDKHSTRVDSKSKSKSTLGKGTGTTSAPTGGGDSQGDPSEIKIELKSML